MLTVQRDKDKAFFQTKVAVLLMAYYKRLGFPKLERVEVSSGAVCPTPWEPWLREPTQERDDTLVPTIAMSITLSSVSNPEVATLLPASK